ncbi:MAG: hypothetical protein O9294_17465 [Cytophagales bacterium]|jgi:hypothetical protein|nr:hypothetical protein [Cytophagales bacterium]
MEVSDESSAEFPDNYDWDSERSKSSFRNFVDENKAFPDYEPFLEQELYPDKEFRKRNDFIFGPVDQYCVSQKAKDILESCNLPKHKFFDVTVYRTFGVFGRKIFRTKLNSKYYAFYYNFIKLNDSLDWIDFAKTEIFAKTGRDEKITLSIKSADEFRQIPIKNRQISDRLKEITDYNDLNFKPLKGFEEEYGELIKTQIGHFESQRIFFNDKFDHSIDVFEIPYFSWMTYISDRLVEKFKANNVTGLILSKPRERQYKVTRPNPELVW